MDAALLNYIPLQKVIKSGVKYFTTEVTST